LLPIYRPSPERIKIHTLTGLVDYINKNVDILDQALLFVHVESPTTVRLYSYLSGDFPIRNEYIYATFNVNEFQFGKFMDMETFLINLQSRFVDTDEKSMVMKFAGNVVGKNVATFANDGVSQSVTAKTSISSVEDVRVPSPITLKPYRTFQDVNQPPGRFIFRMKNNENMPPSAALIEADGGAWKNTAIKYIKTWLSDNIDLPIIA
jgi:hypothetical protein